MPAPLPRLVRIGLPLVLLVALCGFYAWRATTLEVGFARCMAAPTTWDGHTLRLSLWRVESVEPDGYRLSKVERAVPVLGDPTGLRPGDTVSLVARFDAARATLVEVSREVHPLRRAKAGLGVVGMLASLAVALASFRIRGGFLVPRA